MMYYLLYLYIYHLSITNYDIERTDFESWVFQDIDELYELNDKMVDKCDSNMTIWLINLIKLIKKQKIHLDFVGIKIENWSYLMRDNKYNYSNKKFIILVPLNLCQTVLI
jgi:hypothetical protein